MCYRITHSIGKRTGEGYPVQHPRVPPGGSWEIGPRRHGIRRSPSAVFVMIALLIFGLLLPAAVEAHGRGYHGYGHGYGYQRPYPRNFYYYRPHYRVYRPYQPYYHGYYRDAYPVYPVRPGVSVIIRLR